MIIVTTRSKMEQERQPLLSLVDDYNGGKQSCKTRFSNYLKELKNRSITIPCWLLVLYAAMMGLCLELGFDIVDQAFSRPNLSSCWAVEPDKMTITNFLAPGMLFNLVAPLFGWLADIKIGRERAINLSLWSCWFGTLLQVISYCIQYGTCGLPVNIAKYGISGVAFLLIVLGVVAFYTNVLAYALDQLKDHSSAQIRTFVHWLVWGLNIRYLLYYVTATSLSNDYFISNLLISIIIFAFFSLTLIVTICLRHHFEVSRKLAKNPYLLIYKVLLYARQHKAPENRSAFTYWEDEIPTGVNLAKEKYGGPFKEDEVESTKTFWRIVCLLLSTFGFYISYFLAIMDMTSFMEPFQGGLGDAPVVLYNFFFSGALLIIPLLELVIIPLYPKIEYFLLNPLRGIGVAYILLLLTMLSMLLIDVSSHFTTSRHVTCPFSNSQNTVDLNTPYIVYIIPFIFMAFCSVMINVHVYEFICSQAPQNMSGLLTAVYMTLSTFYFSIGGLLKLLFSLTHFDGPSKLSCTFWLLILLLSISLIGFGVYYKTARRYKKRMRQETYNPNTVIEEIYERELLQKN